MLDGMLDGMFDGMFNGMFDGVFDGMTCVRTSTMASVRSEYGFKDTMSSEYVVSIDTYTVTRRI